MGLSDRDYMRAPPAPAPPPRAEPPAPRRRGARIPVRVRLRFLLWRIARRLTRRGRDPRARDT